MIRESGLTIIELEPRILYELWSWPTHMQKFKVNGQSVPKQTDGRTDRLRRLHYPRVNAVGKCLRKGASDDVTRDIGSDHSLSNEAIMMTLSDLQSQ